MSGVWLGKKVFFAGNVLESEVVVDAEETPILVSASFFGKVLSGEKKRTFVRSAPIALALIEGGSKSVYGFSLLLPADIPPSYYGIKHAVVYGVGIDVYSGKGKKSSSVVVEVKGEPGKYHIGGKRILGQALSRSTAAGDNTSAISEFVTKLHSRDSPKWLHTKEKRPLEERLPAVGQLKEELFDLFSVYKAAGMNPLLTFHSLNQERHKSATATKRYIMRKGGAEIAHISLESLSSFAHELATVEVRFAGESEKIKISVEHSETGAYSRSEVLFKEERAVKNCSFIKIPIAVDIFALSLETEEFVSSLKCIIDVDGLFVSLNIGE